MLLHENFEIEVLDFMKNHKLLEPLVFGGGTMLRLCYDLNRYSVDLDFWLLKTIDEQMFFTKAKQIIADSYELTDAKDKQRTMLFKLRSGNYPKRLKIEIRKSASACDHQEQIAFSPESNLQVTVRVHTLEETMQRKILAALDRQLIRDFSDLEFLLRRGIRLAIDAGTAGKLKKILANFKKPDFKVTLGSLLDRETRDYYVANQFTFLETKLNAIENADLNQ